MHHTQKDNKNILDLLAQGRKVPEDFGPDVSWGSENGLNVHGSNCLSASFSDTIIISLTDDFVKRPDKETAAFFHFAHVSCSRAIPELYGMSKGFWFFRNRFLFC